MRTSQNAYVRRYKRRTSFVSLLTTPLNALVMALCCYGYYVLARLGFHILAAEALRAEHLLIGGLLAVTLPSLLVPFLGNLYVLVFKIGHNFCSYIETKPEGLEVRIWPQYRVFCTWENVEREGKSPAWGASYQILRLKDPVSLPESRLVTLLQRWTRLLQFGARLQYRFNPRIFRGYPRGDLADDFRRYAPHLFYAETT